MFYVYLIVSDKNERYIGYSSDLKNRILQHNSGMNRSTKNRKWKLIYYESYLSEKDARLREQKLKHDGRSRRYVYERSKNSLLE